MLPVLEPEETPAFCACDSLQVFSNILALGLTLDPSPDQIFGLHENADITCDQNESLDLFATVLSLQPRTTGKGGGGLSRDELVEKVCTDILSKVREVPRMSLSSGNWI